MRVILPSINEDSNDGKALFIRRLRKEFQNIGVQFGVPADVKLHLIRMSNGGNQAKANVVRIDGVYHNTAQDYIGKNKGIASGFHRGNGAIYQADFSRRLCDKYIGPFQKKYIVCPNGADPTFYDNIPKAESKYTHNFLAVSKWRPHKRLLDIIECYLLAGIEDSCLYVAGSPNTLPPPELARYRAEENIKFLGSVSQEQLGSYYKLCNASIHLCWVDCCPNSVVEAICAGCPVISNNTGGTPEIVKASNGIVCDIDKPYDLEPCDLYHPPNFDRGIIAQAMNDVIDNKPSIDSTNVNIKTVALKYKNFFNSLRR